MQRAPAHTTGEIPLELGVPNRDSAVQMMHAVADSECQVTNRLVPLAPEARLHPYPLRPLLSPTTIPRSLPSQHSSTQTPSFPPFPLVPAAAPLPLPHFPRSTSALIPRPSPSPVSHCPPLQQPPPPPSLSPSDHADLSSVEAALKHLLDLDSQCLRLRQDHKARPQVAVPQALR